MKIIKLDIKKDYFGIIWKNLKSRKIRSYLTVLGVVIGITAIISLIMMGGALQSSVGKQFDKFGTRRIFVGPKFAGGFSMPTGTAGITQDDVDTLKKVPIAEYVTAIYMATASVEYGREKRYMDIGGVELENLEKSFRDVDITIADGRFLEKGDRHSVFIGYRVAKDRFSRGVNVGNSILVDGAKFKVVGILEEEGDSETDNAIRMPIDDLREIKNKPGAITAITATIKPGIDIEFAEKKVFEALKRKRNDENFQVTNPAKIKRQAQSIIGVVKWVFIAIACISLVVGAIGIMNSMYTSVLERTRDIGIMKAIGAKNSTILSMFLIESGFLGLVGGIIGIGIGLAVAIGMIQLINSFGVFTIDLNISYRLMVFGICFAFFLGVLSGALPAYRAARLKPVDALRYE